MTKMSIARVLKERKRIIGEMNTLWNRINQNNVVQQNVRIYGDARGFVQPSKEELAKKRKLDPKDLLDDWTKLRERLIEIKQALHTANNGIAEKLARLSELKSQLQLVQQMPSVSDSVDYYNSDFVRVCDVVFDANWQTQATDSLRKAINTLQDEIDEYNATHYIEFFDL